MGGSHAGKPFVDLKRLHQEDKLISFTANEFYDGVVNGRAMGCNYVYIKADKNQIVKKIHSLNEKDKLIGRNGLDYSVKQISQIIEPSEFYQLSLETKEENLFIDNFLIYNGHTIPNKYNEKYKYLNCDISSPYPNYRSRECIQKDLAFPQFLVVIVFLAVGLIFSMKAIDWIRENHLNRSQ